MKMTFRWYGSQMDPIPLRYIRQIPNMSGVVTSLMDMPAGALWPTERIQAMKEEVNAAGLEMEVIESVNVHEDIKLGLPTRDEYIDNYRETVRRLGRAGVKVIEGMLEEALHLRAVKIHGHDAVRARQLYALRAHPAAY